MLFRSQELRVRVGRNLTKFNLPGAMDKNERIEFEKTMLKNSRHLLQHDQHGDRTKPMTPLSQPQPALQPPRAPEGKAWVQSRNHNQPPDCWRGHRTGQPPKSKTAVDSFERVPSFDREHLTVCVPGNYGPQLATRTDAGRRTGHQHRHRNLIS